MLIKCYATVTNLKNFFLRDTDHPPCDPLLMVSTVLPCVPLCIAEPATSTVGYVCL
jgi:hypothetical protein